MYDFARRPLWILSHVLVIAGVLVMVRLGFWQMSRWTEESDRQDRVEEAMAAPAVPLDAVVDLATPPAEVPEAARYTRVGLQGTWLTDDTVVIRNRSLDGSPGGWLATPLLQADGTAVLVVRGWVPLDVANSGRPFAGTEPPPGEVAVGGVVGLTQRPSGIGPRDPAEGELDSLARVDLERLGEQLEVPLAPVWVQLDAMEPPQDGDLVRTVPVEAPSPSQNFSYMVQWFTFAAIAAGGYVLVLRKVARSRGRPPQDQGAAGQDAPSADPAPAGDADPAGGATARSGAP